MLESGGEGVDGASVRGAEVGPEDLEWGFEGERFLWMCREDMESDERDDSDEEEGELRRGVLIEEIEASGRREKVEDCGGLSLDDWDS